MICKKYKRNNEFSVGLYEMSPLESFACSIFIYLTWKCIFQTPPWNDQWAPNVWNIFSTSIILFFQDWYLHIAFLVTVTSLSYATTNIFIFSMETRSRVFRFVTVIGRLITAGLLAFICWNYIGLFFLSSLCAGGTFGEFQGCEREWDSVQTVFITYSLLIWGICCIMMRLFDREGDL